MPVRSRTPSSSKTGSSPNTPPPVKYHMSAPTSSHNDPTNHRRRRSPQPYQGNVGHREQPYHRDSTATTFEENRRSYADVASGRTPAASPKFGMSIKAKLFAACFGLSCLPTAIGIIVFAYCLQFWLAVYTGAFNLAAEIANWAWGLVCRAARYSMHLCRRAIIRLFWWSLEGVTLPVWATVAVLGFCFNLFCPTICSAAGWLFKWLVPEWLIPDEADIEPPRPRRPRNMFYGNYNFAPSATTLDDELDMVEGLNIYSYSRTPWEGEVFRHERFERRPQTFTADHRYRTTDESYRNRTWRSASVTSMSTFPTQSSGTTNRQIAPGTTNPQQTSPHTSPTPKSAQRRRNTFHSPPASPPHAQQRRKSPPESPAPIQTGGRGKIVELPASPTSPEREEKEVVGKTPAEGEDKKVRRDSRASFDSGYGTEGAPHSPESPVASS